MPQAGRIYAFLLLAALFLAGGAWGQEFEVVDIRPAQPLPPGAVLAMLENGPGVIQPNPTGVSPVRAQPYNPNGTVNLRFYTIRQLITSAYTEVLRPDYLIGGPNWLDADRFDLLAKTAAETSVSDMRQMLQRALADRFHLAVHREQKSMPTYALIAAKNVSKLKPAAQTNDPACKFAPGDGGQQHRVCSNMTMAELAKQLPSLAPAYVDLPVVNATGLSGGFDFELEWSQRRPGADVEEDTIFTALEKLGLKLEERKQPMPVIVIDHVDRAPTEN